MRDFIGQNDFTWFIGVVEDRDDPLQLGRVRVRCYGWHTDDKNQIPTEALPWAIQLQGITSPALNGMGQSPTGLVEGSWIVGFFLDGERAQEPLILGSIASAPSEYGNPKKGFFDPRYGNQLLADLNFSVYPKYINETDVNRLARHNSIDPETKEKIHETDPVFNTEKDTYATLNVPKANTPTSGSHADTQSTPSDVEETWSERRTIDLTKSGIARYKTKYPKNHVYESESGHTVEFDDTENAERINEHHKSGTFYEIDADGNKVTRIVGNNYEIVAKNNNVNIKGDVNLTIDSNCRTYIKGNWDIQVVGNKTEYIKGDVKEYIDKTKTEVVKKAVTETYCVDEGNQKTEIVSGNLDIDAKRIDLN